MTKWLAMLGVCCSSLAIANNDFSNFFNSFDTLSANFAQQTYSGTNAPLAKTSGHLRFKRPNQFIWQTESPIAQTLLLTDNELWLIDDELEQANRRSINELQNTPLYWLTNRPDQLKVLPMFDYSESDIRWYNTQQENKLSFGFTKGQLIGIKLNNQLGQQILVNLSALKINPVFAQDTFKLKLGSNFDVIR